MTTPLRCGLQDLSAAETVLVRTLFKLYRHSSKEFRWTLVDAAPYDAILVGGTSADLAAHRPAGVKAVLPLPRPLRSEMLEAWLLQTQREYFPLDGAGGSLQPARPADTVALRPAEPADAGVYKLTRWPPAAMLRNDPGLVRMATLLSRRPMKISELAQVSQQTWDSALAFVFALRRAELLSSPTTTSMGHTTAPEASPMRANHAPRKVERSLMNRIRQRLGL